MKFELIERPVFDLSGERSSKRSIRQAVCCFIVSNALNAYAASEQAGAIKDANNKDIQAAKDNNDLNYKMFQQARGSEGNSIFPLYAKGDNGQAFEPQLFKDTVGIYNSLDSNPGVQLDRYRNALATLNGAEGGAEDTVSGIYNGGLEREAVANQQPVNQGRQAVANSSLTALAQTLNDIKTINARKGYSGDSFGTRLLQFNARKGAGEEMAQANLANAMDERGIHSNAMVARINNVRLPYAMGQQALNNVTQPEDTLLDRANRRATLFNWARIGPQAYQYQRLPETVPVPSAGALAAQGGANAVDSILSYYTGGQYKGSKNNYFGQSGGGQSGFGASSSQQGGGGGLFGFGGGSSGGGSSGRWGDSEGGFS